MHIGNNLPERGQMGDLHAVMTGRFDDGSVAIRIYVCESSGDRAAGNPPAWALFQRAGGRGLEA
jgi:hypothetical protein